MARFKLYIEYEGTRYSGWQMQKNSTTVQGKLVEVAGKIFKTQQIELYGSGRTDAGVHALCQVAHLEVETMLAPEIIRMKINDKLPTDINIIEVEKIHSKFHARYDTVSRSYLYQISQRRTAFGKPFVWWVNDELDFPKMESAAKLFIGMHNFESFAEKDKEEKSTKVLINDVQLLEDGALILIRIVGSHFLWKMVRRMVGILVEIGCGKMSEEDIHSFLENFSPIPAKHTAPPSGLFLERITYGKENKNVKITPIVAIEKMRRTIMERTA